MILIFVLIADLKTLLTLNSRQKVNLFLRLSISVIILGILFKILHFPYSEVLFIGGAIGIIVFYSLRFQQKHPKVVLDYSKLFLLIAFLFHYVFRVLHLSYGFIFTTLTQIALVLFVILYIRDVLFSNNETEEVSTPETKRNSVRKGLNYLLYGIAAVGIIVGAQFKIVHWEFGFINGSTLLTVGLFAAVASVFLATESK